jgi:hypothetical protein
MMSIRGTISMRACLRGRMLGMFMRYGFLEEQALNLEGGKSGKEAS